MSKITFQSSAGPSLGVEVELALVDEKTMELSSSIQDVLDRVPEQHSRHIKPELLQCFLEVNTGICQTVAEAEADLRTKIGAIERVTDELGLRIYWTSTHPSSLWEDQKVTPTERYLKLLTILQDMGRQLVTFGLHVHVGVGSGDKAIMICDRIMRHLPTLLALSCNSPWWNGRVSGLQSHRTKIMEGLPTAGLPSLMRNWSEYVWLVKHLVATGFINTIREIWWDVRPHHNFGTVEVRVCDMPGRLEDVSAIAALVQCLVRRLSDDIDEGAYQHDCHPMLVRQNKWRATRYGMDAELVDSFTLRSAPAREVVARLVDELRPTAGALACQEELEGALSLANQPTWAQRQLELAKTLGDPAEIVRRLTTESRLSPPPR